MGVGSGSGHDSRDLRSRALVTVVPSDSGVELATVLIIEDEAVVRQSIVDVLEHSGYDVLSYSDAEPALEDADFDAVDLVITDLAMPTRGEEAIYTLRSSGVQVPIVILSGMVKDRDDIPLQTIGADRILAKPFDIKILLDTVRELLPAS